MLGLKKRDAQTAAGAPAADSGIDLRKLCTFIPLRHLDRGALNGLKDQFQLLKRGSGEAIFEADGDDTLFFLLVGAMTVTRADGRSYRLEAGTGDADHALRPQPGDRAEASSGAAVLACIAAEPVDKLLHEGPDAGIGVEEIQSEDPDVDKRIFHDIYHQYMSDELEAPSLPDVAFRVREAVDDPDASAESVATMIQTAPTLAAFCMKTANSAAYNPTSPITGIREAVVRLGLATTRDLVTGYCMRSLFKANHPEFETVMREIWWHSCQVGVVACVLARQLKTVNPEQALLAGLVHDIGSVVLVSEAQKHMKNGIDAVTLTTLIRELRGQVSAMVLRRWNFDESIVEAAVEAENWKHDSGDGTSIADLVTLAHLYVRNSLPTWTSAPPANETVPAYGKLPETGDDMESRLELIDSAAADIDAMLALLRS